MSRVLEFNKLGFDGLQCSHCGEMIPAGDVSTERESVRCPVCGWVMPTVRQTIRVLADRDLLARPPSVVVDEGSVDGDHRIFIRRRPLGRARIVSFLGWLFLIVAVEAALVFGFDLNTRECLFDAAAPFVVRLASTAAVGLAFLFVFVSLLLLVLRTRAWRISLSDEEVRMRTYLLGVLPWVRATVVKRSSFLFAECVWYGGARGRTPYCDLSLKRRPENFVLYADDGSRAWAILTSEDFEVVLYVRALLNAWRGVVKEFPCPSELSEEEDQLVYHPAFLPGSLGVSVALALYLVVVAVERLSAPRSLLAPLVLGLCLLSFSVIRKACAYRFCVRDNELVCTFRCLGMAWVRRYELKGAVIRRLSWLGAQTVFLCARDGKRHRLVTDVPDRSGDWIVGWFAKRIGGDLL